MEKDQFGRLVHPRIAIDCLYRSPTHLLMRLCPRANRTRGKNHDRSAGMFDGAVKGRIEAIRTPLADPVKCYNAPTGSKLDKNRSRDTDPGRTGRAAGHGGLRIQALCIEECRMNTAGEMITPLMTL